MEKLLRPKKVFARGHVSGHNVKNCEVCQEIQSVTYLRIKEKRGVKKLIKMKIDNQWKVNPNW